VTTPQTRSYETGTDKLLCVVDNGIGKITFNNPEKHNALSLSMQQALVPALAALAADSDVRVVVLTGAGNKAFVSGADISEFGEQRTAPEARAAYDRVAGQAASAWRAMGKPIIAMIRGYCIGGGLITAMQADIRIAAADAQFAIPAARLGLGYAYGGVEALVGLVGPAHAAEILFSARRLAATEALQIGLINRVVPTDELEATVDELARAIGANAPMTVAACKAAISELRRVAEHRDVGRVNAMIEACFQSQDYLEGQRAFAEKRPPRFAGS
jgi:enoyl-CoA hydratase